MVRLVDEALRSTRFGLHNGIAAPSVTLADPATGTGTFLLGVLRQIAETVRNDEGEGAVREALNAALPRIIAFEMQLGPFAVAQLRILAEIVDLTGAPPQVPSRMYVTDTLGNPFLEQEWLPATYQAIGESRKEANKVKREETITVVLGNPPYKEKAKGRGGWIEGEDKAAEKTSPLAEWMPPKEWKIGVHAKHLRNLYVYFWRWATWKVFDHGPGEKNGMVCFITMAGFLNGPGFQKMRDYLRRACDDIWVIDCSPEGHQPEVATRIFQGVQQPVCIVLASRSPRNRPDTPARVRFLELPSGNRRTKFDALENITLRSRSWKDCPTDWRAPFQPGAKGNWATYPAIDEFFVYNGSGVMPGRTWIIAPDAQSLEERWKALVSAPQSEKETLFHPHLRGGKLGDKHSRKIVTKPLAGYPSKANAVADERGDCLPPTRFGYRSFDRQWIVPDSRLINQPNPFLWAVRSDRQVFLTALARTAPSNGPAITITGLIPDLDHYKGSFGGRVFPLWRDAGSTNSNIRPNLFNFLKTKFRARVSGEEVIAYIAAVAAHPAYTSRFQADLSRPGLRIPFTADAKLFAEAVELGRTIIWLHTFGERFADPKKGRPAGPPRLPQGKRPTVPKGGAIPTDPESMPDEMTYDETEQRLYVGTGYVENVPLAVWSYEVSGKRVLTQWFSYRKRNRSRPQIGDKRPPSPLGDIQPNHWLAEYTTELINVLNVLGCLVELESKQSDLLERICSGNTISNDEFVQANAFELPKEQKATSNDLQPSLFGDETG